MANRSNQKSTYVNAEVYIDQATAHLAESFVADEAFAGLANQSYTGPEYTRKLMELFDKSAVERKDCEAASQTAEFFLRVGGIKPLQPTN